MSGHQERSAFYTPPPSLSPLVSFHPFVDGGILHWRKSHRVWVLNASSAYLWCLLEEVASTEELASHLVDRFGIDHSTARQDVALTLAAFTQEGLLLACPTSPRLLDDNNCWTVDCPAGPALLPPEQWAVKEFLHLPGQTIEFCCQDLHIGAEFIALVPHLKRPGEAAPDMRLAVAEGHVSNRWEIYLNGRLFLDHLAPGEVLPHLFTLIFVKVSEALGDALLFHAAIIGGQGRAVMFPAEAGSGKTTLVAALAARGHLFFSDELAVLDRKELTLRPLAMPMSIKPGSTAILERYYPGLSAKAVHPRADGQKVRYLTPPSGSLAASDLSGAAIEAIVFPRYRAGAKTSLVELDKVSALQRLVQTGSSDRELVEADIEALIGAVEQHPCYALEYADLAEVIELLEATFACLSKAPQANSSQPGNRHRHGSPGQRAEAW